MRVGEDNLGGQRAAGAVAVQFAPGATELDGGGKIIDVPVQLAAVGRQGGVAGVACVVPGVHRDGAAGQVAVVLTA